MICTYFPKYLGDEMERRVVKLSYDTKMSAFTQYLGNTERIKRNPGIWENK